MHDIICFITAFHLLHTVNNSLQAPNICSFQTANYSIEIIYNGQVNYSYGPVEYQSNQTSQRVEITDFGGLKTNRFYVLQITIKTEFGQTEPVYHVFGESNFFQ